ncbi:MAG: hypothetical protein KKH68_14300 [Proteobacteria bacterium]|nr:hypothetical protein [Pseudomonadota bacterium]
MTAELKKIYFTLLIPAGLGFIIIRLVSAFNLFTIGAIKVFQVFAPMVFVLAVFFAVALPIFFRTLFAHKMRHRKNISKIDLIKFERSLIGIISVAPYLALAAYIFEFPRFYCAGILLSALYAVYFYYPSEKRIRFDQRLFRVK